MQNVYIDDELFSKLILKNGGHKEYNIVNINETNDKEFMYYYLYEYSDNIITLLHNPIYPSLLNYVKTGILTEDEMISAILRY